MKRFAGEKGTWRVTRRRWVVQALSAIPAMSMLSASPRAVRAQSDGVKGEYVLSSAARAKRIQQLVSSG
jgi:hypothetical protein